MTIVAKMLEAQVGRILTAPWQSRLGRVVPEPAAVLLLGGAVELDGTVLYADLARSSYLATEFDERVGAKVVKSFLSCTATLIRRLGGKVTSFDGDRVMGVFVGQNARVSAIDCGLSINWAISQTILPRVKDRFSSLEKAGFLMSHAVGIDSGKVFVVRVGYRGQTDLVWVGRAPNLAAKLSDIRVSPYSTFVTKEVLEGCPESSWFGGDPPSCIWDELSFKWLDNTIPIYASSWYRIP